MKEIKVKNPACPSSFYTIKIGCDFLSTTLSQIKKDFPAKELFIISDSNVAKAKHLRSFLKKENVRQFIIKPAGEKSKNINTIIKIIEKMEKEALGRDSVIIALGGGTVGDMAGFAGAIFKRGIDVVQIPTTTVAQADSSIGGKTGVDSKISKNAFGAFKNPSAVFIDVNTLKTLDKKQFNAGFVESIKHALIADEKYLNFIIKNLHDILARNNETLEYVAVKNCEIKGKVVEGDPYEKNKRRILNYGHTIGHAIESASNYKILHGQAVAIGIIAANIIEKQLGLGGEKRIQMLKDLFAKLEIDLSVPKSISKKRILDIISRDKKAVKKWPNFVLLESAGKVLCRNGQYAHKVERSIVEDVIDCLLKKKY